MARAFATILLCVLTAAGAFVAGLAARPGSAPSRGHGGAGEGGADPGGAVAISPQTQRNLGVEIGAVELGQRVRTRKVHAVVEDRPENTRPIEALLGGVVTEVAVETGALVPAGTVLLLIARDAIDPPRPDLTAELILPLSEAVHEGATKLQELRAQLEIARRESERLRPFTESGGADDLPIVNRQKSIELEYEIERSALAVQSARWELRRHGLTEAEVEAVERGSPPPRGPQIWQRVLQENALWTPTSTRILDTLPESLRQEPWVVIAVAELTAAGRASEELAQLFETMPEATRRFGEAAGLLLTGMSVAQLRVLAAQGALEPEMAIRAPTGGPSDWDVTAVNVRPGQRVAPGALCLTLHDARRLWLRVEPAGAEVEYVVRALQEGTLVAGQPLTHGAGPPLRDVRIERMGTRPGPPPGSTIAWAALTNRVVEVPEGLSSRSWALRPGTRYTLEVPVMGSKEGLLLPAGSLAEDGIDTVVYLKDGASFRPVKVHVLYRDEDVVVLEDDGSLFVGDPVVVEGAFALSLALQRSRGGGEDPHAHHGHAH